MAAKGCFIYVAVTLLAVSQAASLRPSVARHPLLPSALCYAFGPQAVFEALREKVDHINADQMNKYHKILKYLVKAPELMYNYATRGDISVEHGDMLVKMEKTLRQRLQLLRVDVLLPWARLMQQQEMADVSGPLRTATRRALQANLRLTLNATEETNNKILDNISGLVDQYRRLFLGYKDIMVSWLESAWMDDTEEEKKQTMQNILWHELPPMFSKPLVYLLEDKNLDYYHPYPCGYEEVFNIHQKLRLALDHVNSPAGDDATWKLLLKQLPRGGSSSEEPRPLTQAQIEMEEEVLSTHIVDMLTGYPEKKGKQW